MGRVAVCLFGLLIACEATPQRVGWQIEFGEPSVAQAAVNVQAYVTTGDCAGLRFFEADLARGEQGADPGPLVPGRYGFGAEAFDASCRRLASACVDVDWPPDDEIRVVLAPTSVEAACTAVECVQGRCEQPQVLPCGTPGPCAGPVVEVRAGRSHTCARTAAGDVWCWGRGDEGQLGRPGVAVLPQSVSLPFAAQAIAAGGADAEPSGHSCAVATDGRVWCWGGNDAGQAAPIIETPTVAPTLVPDVTATTIETGGRFTCALTVDEEVTCWGAGEQFQLGDGAMTARAGPTPVPLTAAMLGLGLGDAHACAVSDRGRLFCWGRAQDGQLGNVTSRPTPNIVEVNNGRDARLMAVGSKHVCFARTGPPATFACFGSNDGFQLGRSDVARNARPTEPASVQAPETIDRIATGGAHTCLLRDTGRVYCFGDNSDGQLGLPSVVRTATPTEVLGLSNIVDIDAGFRHTCAVQVDGRVWCWGRNRFGQLGDGSTESRFSPVRVLGLGTE